MHVGPHQRRSTLRISNRSPMPILRCSSSSAQEESLDAWLEETAATTSASSLQVRPLLTAHPAGFDCCPLSSTNPRVFLLHRATATGAVYSCRRKTP